MRKHFPQWPASSPSLSLDCSTVERFSVTNYEIKNSEPADATDFSFGVRLDIHYWNIARNWDDWLWIMP